MYTNVWYVAAYGKDLTNEPVKVRMLGADLVLCGRQASDDDHGVVPALVGEILDIPTVTIAK